MTASYGDLVATQSFKVYFKQLKESEVESSKKEIEAEEKNVTLALPPYPKNSVQQRLSISKVSERGAFNVTSEEPFFYFDNLKELLIEEPENRTAVFNVTVLQLN